MFDDFDMGISVEEISGYDAYEAFENFYGEGFEDYCDSLEREQKLRSSFISKDFYDEI
jgi:hypothetical protein